MHVHVHAPSPPHSPGVKRLAKLGLVPEVPGMAALDMNTAEGRAEFEFKFLSVLAQSLCQPSVLFLVFRILSFLTSCLTVPGLPGVAALDMDFGKSCF